jgi:predicted nuclease with TOPRIM domain
VDPTEQKRAEVDLEEARRLADALDEDLAKLQQGAGDVETLRREVAQLRAALRIHGEGGRVHERLHGIRALLHKAEDEVISDAFAAGDYIARIGRMLGM